MIPEKCTNRSRPPSSGVMKPNPFSSENHLTVPVPTDEPHLLLDAVRRCVSTGGPGPNGQTLSGARPRTQGVRFLNLRPRAADECGMDPAAWRDRLPRGQTLPREVWA